MDQFVFILILPNDMISNPHLQRPASLPMPSLQESPHSHGSPWHQSQTAGGAVKDCDKNRTTYDNIAELWISPQTFRSLFWTKNGNLLGKLQALDWTALHGLIWVLHEIILQLNAGDTGLAPMGFWWLSSKNLHNLGIISSIGSTV